MVYGALSLGCAAQPASSGDQTQEIVDNLIQAGFPGDDIQVVGGKVYAGRDAEVSLQSSREMITPRVATSQDAVPDHEPGRRLDHHDLCR